MKRLIKQGVGITLFTICMVIPYFLMAKSENHIDKVITITKDQAFSENQGQVAPPHLKIKVIDSLTEGNRFYLNLEGAVWQEATLTLIEDDTTKVTAKKLTDTQMEVKVESGTIKQNTQIEVPLQVKVVAPEAKVIIDANNTTVTNETLTFAYGSDAKVGVSVPTPLNKMTQQGTVTPIYIEEAYGGQLKTAMGQESDTVVLNVDHPAYTLFVTEEAKIIGEKGYEGLSVGKEHFRIIDDQHIEIKLPDTIRSMDSDQKGTLKIDGIGIKILEPIQQEHVVKGTLSGGVITTQMLDIVEVVDYNVDLMLGKHQSFVSGNNIQVNIELQESIEGALVRERPIHVSLTEPIKGILNEENKVEVMINGINQVCDPIVEKGRVVGFTIHNLEDEAFDHKTNLKIDFTAQIPLTYTGNIAVQIEGSGLPKNLEGVIGDTYTPITLQSEAFQVKSGVKDQQGGMLFIRESGAGKLKQNGNLEIILDTEYLKLEEVPAIAVTEGDLVLGEAKLTEEGISIPIIKASTTPSTIVIKHFTLTLDGTVPKGRYEVACTGTALSDLDEKLVEEDFVLVEVGPKNKKQITFKLGEEAYAVNGKYHHLDVVPYLEDGRVMVPVKYVVEALGMKEDQLKFNDENNQVIIYGDKVIELEIGSDTIKVDGASSKMQTKTQLIEGRTMVPIGEIARALGVEVSWNAPLETATFISYYE